MLVSVWLSGSKSATGSKVVQLVAVGRSTGERGPNESKTDAVFVPGFLQSLVRGCP